MTNKHKEFIKACLDESITEEEAIEILNSNDAGEKVDKPLTIKTIHEVFNITTMVKNRTALFIPVLKSPVVNCFMISNGITYDPENWKEFIVTVRDKVLLNASKSRSRQGTDGEPQNQRSLRYRVKAFAHQSGSVAFSSSAQSTDIYSAFSTGDTSELIEEVESQTNSEMECAEDNIDLCGDCVDFDERCTDESNISFEIEDAVYTDSRGIDHQLGDFEDLSTLEGEIDEIENAIEDEDDEHLDDLLEDLI